MRVLVTGARGFVGRNLCAQLNNIREGKVPGSPVRIEEVMEYDLESEPNPSCPDCLSPEVSDAGEGSTSKELERMCRRADFVFNLAGVNRPADPADFRRVNVGFAARLLDTLRRAGNRCPVMLASSIQASLSGRYVGHPYAVSKRECEILFFDYERLTGARTLVYRFPNIFGKWCRPNYNSVIATFCHNIANGLPIRVDDPRRELELLYIDDLVDEMVLALQGREHRCTFDPSQTLPAREGEDQAYCHVPRTFRVTLGEIVEMLRGFASLSHSLTVPQMPSEGFAKRIFATFLSYLPNEKAAFDLRMNVDRRGAFTELVRTEGCGQLSVNVLKPGVTKGNHWHNTKWEQFVVVSGHGLIRMRRIGTREVTEYEVSGDRLRSVVMLPGHTHSIENLSDTDDLTVVIYASEPFYPDRPDTFAEPI